MAGGLIGGAVAGGVTSGLQALMSAKAAKKAYRRMIRFYGQRHQLEAKDLEAAGLNRILSLTKGPGVATAVPMARIPELSSVAESGRKTSLLQAQLGQIRASTAKTVAEERLLRAGVPTAEAKEDVLQWFFGRMRKMIGEGASSAKGLLSPEAKSVFGLEQRHREPIRIVPKGRKYKGEK